LNVSHLLKRFNVHFYVLNTRLFCGMKSLRDTFVRSIMGSEVVQLFGLWL